MIFLPYFCIIVIALFAWRHMSVADKLIRDQRIQSDQRQEDNKDFTLALKQENRGLLDRCLARNGFAPIGEEKKQRPDHTPPQPTGQPPQMRAQANARNSFNAWKEVNGKNEPVKTPEQLELELNQAIEEAAANSVVRQANVQ